jgi:hypothetical protein
VPRARARALEWNGMEWNAGTGIERNGIELNGLGWGTLDSELSRVPSAHGRGLKVVACCPGTSNQNCLDVLLGVGRGVTLGRLRGC